MLLYKTTSLEIFSDSRIVGLRFSIKYLSILFKMIFAAHVYIFKVLWKIQYACLYLMWR